MADDRLAADAKRVLSSVLDQLIPERLDVELPGAGELGVGEVVIRAQGDALPALKAVLCELDAQATSGGAADFSALPHEERAALLAEVDAANPGFLPGLIFHAYTAYYQQPRVVEALGLEARPPYPKGYELEMGDLGLLDPVRERKGLYREA